MDTPDHLLIVSRDTPHFCEALKQRLIGVSGVRVILDRRQEERRQVQVHHPERRTRERRQTVHAPRPGWFVYIPPELIPSVSSIPQREITRQPSAFTHPLRAVQLVARWLGIALLCLGVFLAVFFGTTILGSILFYSDWWLSTASSLSP